MEQFRSTVTDQNLIASDIILFGQSSHQFSTIGIGIMNQITDMGADQWPQPFWWTKWIDIGGKIE